MANVRTLQRSFGGGEVTPEFFGRIDDPLYQAGAALLRNFITLPHGPAANRPGFAFVREVKDSSKRVKLIPFTFSTTQTMTLEFGDQYIRFHTQGATLLSAGVPYEVATPYLEADLFDLHYVQSADVLTIVHPNYAPRELRRLGATNWALTLISFVPSLSTPASVVAAPTVATGTPLDTNYLYKVTGVGATGLEESTASAASAVIVNNLLTTGNYNTIAWWSTGATRYNVYKESNGLYGYIGQTDALTFKDDNITADLGKTPPSGVNPFINNSILSIPVVSSGTGYTGGPPLGLGWVQLTITDATGTGADALGLWNVVAGKIDSVWVALGGENYTNPTITVTSPGAGSGIVFGPVVLSGSGHYPGAVSYFEQRRCFAGSINEPQNLRLTRSGTESNLSYSIPTRDDDAINIRVAARGANTIRHIVPLSNLVLLTGAAEWRVTSVNSDAITPTSVSVKPQSYIGANNVQPLIVNNNILYAASRGGHMREMAFNYQAGGYITGDLSLRTPHLFDGFDVVDMAYAKAPQPLVWAVSSNGKLLGLTYVPEQRIGAWHHHDTDGLFESCCVVAEGIEDALYAVVKRTIGGATKRYIERMAPRLFATQADAFFVDSGLTYDGTPTSTLSGLDHLEGKTVSVLGDGAVFPQKVVTAGAITLDEPCSKVQVGLPITADLQTLPLAVEMRGDGSAAQGRYKNINKVWLRVYRSSGVFVGPNENNLTEAKQRGTEAPGSAPNLKSEEIPVTLTPSWADSGQIFIRQSDPLPLTMASLIAEVVLGG